MGIEWDDQTGRNGQKDESDSGGVGCPEPLPVSNLGPQLLVEFLCSDPRPVYRNQGLAELTHTRSNLCC